MRTLIVNSFPLQLVHTFQKSVKFIVPLVLLAYVFLHLSLFQWLLIGVLAVCAMAVVSKFSQEAADSASTAINDSKNKPGFVHTDGGAFRRPETVNQTSSVRPVVHDGGSHERSSVTTQSRG